MILFAFSLLPSRAEAPPPAPKASAATPIAVLTRRAPVDFESEILPIFKNNCLACHGMQKPKGGLVLETPQTIAKGGDSGAAVVPGKGEESFLLQVAAHQVEDTIMPPKDNKVKAANLSSDELGLLRLWIDQGAKGEVRGRGAIEWQAMPPALRAIHAVALTEDGQYAACARANQIFIYHVPTQRLAARLSDPALASSGLYGSEGAAHHDFVNALAFNPAGDVLASGGYRDVKLWQRVKTPPRMTLASVDSKAVHAVALSPDGQRLATGGADSIVKVWNAADGTLIKEICVGTNGVQALAFSPDGGKLLCGAGDKSLSVWEMPEGSLYLRLETPAPVHAVAWAMGGKVFLAGGDDKLIRAWDLPAAAGGEVAVAREWSGHEGAVTALKTVDAEGKQILSGSADGTVRLWSAETGQSLRQMNHGGAVTSVAVSPDGKQFASAGLNHMAKLWQAGDGKQLAEMKGDRYVVEQLAARERQKVVAAAEVAYRKTEFESAEKEQKTQADRLAKAREAFEPADKAFAEKKKAQEEALQAKAESEKSLANLHAEIDRVTEEFEKANASAKKAEAEAKSLVERAASIQVAAEKSFQAKAEADAFLVEAQKFAERARAGASLSSLSAEEKATAERRASDSEAVAAKARALVESAAQQAEAKAKSAGQTRSEADKAIEQVAALSFAAGRINFEFDKITIGVDERLKAATNAINEAGKKVTAAEKEFTKAEMERSRAETEMRLAEKAETEATQMVTSNKAAWEGAQTGEKDAAAAVEAAKQKATDSEKPMRSVAFAKDGMTLITAGDDGAVRTWTTSNGQAVEAYPVQPTAARTVAVAASGEVWVAGEGSSVFSFSTDESWTLQKQLGSGDELSVLADRVNALAFSPDGKWLATGGGQPSRSGEIKVWDVTEGKVIKDWPNVHSDSVLSLAFSPDGKQLASGATDKFAKVVDVATGAVVKTLEGHTHHVMGVSWKADGRTLATSGADNVVKVWDVVKGERKKNIQGFDKQVTSVQFVGATDQAVVSAGDNKVRLLKENGDQVRAFSGVTEFQHAAAATPDGTLIVAGGEESVLRVWNGQDGKLISAFAAPDAK